MRKTILYSTNTGFTKEYAEILSKELDIPAHNIDELEVIPTDTRIIYLGWILGDRINGLEKVSNGIIDAIIGVGLNTTNTRIEEVKKKNNIGDTKLFTVQGGVNWDLLKGMNKIILKMIANKEAKRNIRDLDSDEEIVMHKLLVDGGSCVSIKNLESFLEWYRSIN